MTSGEPAQFDPRALLATLEANRVSYVVIGAFARVIRGTDELTGGLDICPALRPPNCQPLERALAELNAVRADGARLNIDEVGLSKEPTLRLRTRYGQLSLVPYPAGTRKGYDDLRRGATREHLGQGLRPQVASVPDLARMAAALARATDLAPLRELRRILEVEPDIQRARGFGIDR